VQLPSVIEVQQKKLKEARLQLERDRYGPDLMARCGCVFLPWQRKEFGGKYLRGVGLIIQCDQSNRLMEFSLAHWETHTYLAREDAENRLEEIVRLLAAQRGYPWPTP
jgi:hypothetical protein